MCMGERERKWEKDGKKCKAEKKNSVDKDDGSVKMTMSVENKTTTALNNREHLRQYKYVLVRIAN